MYRIEQRFPDHVPDDVNLHPGPPTPFTYFIGICTMISTYMTIKMYIENRSGGSSVSNILYSSGDDNEEKSPQKELDEFE